MPRSLQDFTTGSFGCPSCISEPEIFSIHGLGLIEDSRDIQAMAFIATPFGRLRLTAKCGYLVDLEFDLTSGEEKIPANPVLQEAARQFARYFNDPNARFSLPLKQAGTEHARRVWKALTEIPPGRIETYGGLARLLGSGPRAVAAACRANAFPICIPCHRVVAAAGLGGYCGQVSGPMLEIKRWLLTHEGCPLD